MKGVYIFALPNIIGKLTSAAFGEAVLAFAAFVWGGDVS